MRQSQINAKKRYYNIDKAKELHSHLKAQSNILEHLMLALCSSDDPEEFESLLEAAIKRSDHVETSNNFLRGVLLRL